MTNEQYTELQRDRLKAANEARRDELARLRRENARLMQALEALLAYVEDGYGDAESAEGEAARAVLADCRPEIITDKEAL